MSDQDKSSLPKDDDDSNIDKTPKTQKAGQSGQQTQNKTTKEEKDGATSADDSDAIKSCMATTSAAASSADQDDSKKEADTSKAVTFAEDIEVYDLKAGTPITVSLDTPVHLVEPEKSGTWTLAGTRIEDQKDGSAGKENKQESKDQDGFSSVDLAAASTSSADQKGKEQQSSPGEKQQPAATATRPNLLSLITGGGAPAVIEPSSNAAASTTDSSQAGTEPDSSSKPRDDTVDPSDQKFIVSAVDESELHVEIPTVEENGHIPSSFSSTKEGLLEGDLHLLRETSASGQSSHSNDSMQHDTIGPLENPAFLKTLQYSSSQPFDDDLQYGLHSNIDVSSLAVGQNDPNLDGGWAWVVLVAAFVNSVILSASCLLAGVMMTSFVRVTKSDMTKTSWIGSIYISIMCLAGPFVGTVTRKFGARLIICAAGVVMFFGFIGASFADTVVQLILTHSVLAGIGAGLAINPTFVIVGQYFNSLRGLACGLMATGGGAGFLAGGALISQLLHSYELSGAYLIWAAVCFNITAMGMLMRPSPEEKLREVERIILINDPAAFNASSQHELVSGHNSMISGLNSMYSGTDQQSTYSGLDRISEGRRSSRLQRPPSKQSSSGGDADVPLLKTIFHREMSRSSHSMSTNKSGSLHHNHKQQQHHRSSSSMQRVHSPYGSNTLTPTPAPSSPLASPTTTSPLAMDHNSTNALSSHNVASTNSLATPYMRSTSTIAAPTSSSLAIPASPTSTRANMRSTYQRPRLLSSISQPTSHYTSLSFISQRMYFKDDVGNPRDMDNESMTSTLVNNLRPMDTLNPRYNLGSMSISAIIGSLASFPTSLAIINDDLSRLDKIVPVRHKRKTIKDYLIDMLDALRIIFNNRPFVVFLGTCFLWAFGESPITLYLSSYAISCGTDPMQASTLYTAMGVGSIIGRFLTGLIATDTNIGPMLLHIGCLGLAGILVVLSPLITSTLMEQMLFSSLLGVYTGSLVPLMSLMTIEMLGISELSVGFGFLSMAQGFGYLIGPPLSGVLVSQVGFHYSFVCSGVLLICGSILGLFIPMLIHVEDEDDNNSMDELERALRRVTSDDGSGSDEDRDDDDDDDDDISKKDKDEELKSKYGSVLLPVVGSAGENHHSLLPEDSSFVSIVRNLEEGDDKLETIKEIM